MAEGVEIAEDPAEEPVVQNNDADSADALAFAPRTALGERLWKIRAKIVASGEKLLGWEEIERQVSERRGGAHDPAAE